MLADLYRGQLVRLVFDDPTAEGMAHAQARWQRNSDYRRNLDTAPPAFWSTSKGKEWIEKEFGEPKLTWVEFNIRRLEDDRLLGFIGLSDIQPNHGDCWVGIGIGESDCWGKGYGTDAMRLALRYAFQELNLQRVSLDVFVHNRRAVRSYEKAGFKPEGVERQLVARDGQRLDVLVMGILREEWVQMERQGAVS